jgi:hypothetical protein
MNSVRKDLLKGGLSSYNLTREIIKFLYKKYYKNINSEKIDNIVDVNINERKINKIVKNLDSNFITIYDLNNQKFLELLYNNFFSKDFNPLHNKIVNEMNKGNKEISQKKRNEFLENKLKNDIADKMFDHFVNMAYIFKLHNRYNIEFNDESIYNTYLNLISNECKSQSVELKNCLYKKKEKINMVPVSNFIGNTEKRCKKVYNNFDKCMKKYIR